MAVVNAAAALGEAVGHLIERRLSAAVALAANSRGYSAGPRRLVNGAGNRYQIDCVVSTPDGQPVIIVDPKYIRYKKHNRDKGSWLCVAHYNLRKSHPTIRKSITILTGRWSQPSVQLIKSFGIEVHEVPFDLVVSSLGARGVEFDWAEKDRVTPARAWARFLQLSGAEREAIADEIASSVSLAVTNSVAETLDADWSAIEKQVTQVEVLLKTSHNEIFLSSHSSITAAVQALVRLLSDKPDVGGLLR